MLVQHTDRFGRDAADNLLAKKTLGQLNVALRATMHEIADTPEGDLVFGVQSLVASYQRLLQRQKGIQGLRRRVEQGAYPGRIAPYGYRRTGQKATVRLEIDDDEARIVRQIFERVASGQTCIKIASWLNGEGLLREDRLRKQSVLRRWRPSSIATLVRNEVYRGLLKYKQEVEVAVPVIVDAVLWRRAQRALKKNQIFATGSAKRRYLLTGLLRCGDCEKEHGRLVSLSGAVRHQKSREHVVYRCLGSMGRMMSANVYDDETKRCHGKLVDGDALEAWVWKEIQQLAAKPGDVRRLLRQRFNSAQKNLDQLQAEAVRLLAQVKAKIEARRRAAQQLAEGLIDKDDFLVIRDRLNAEIEELGDQSDAAAHAYEQAKYGRQVVSSVMEWLKALRQRTDSHLDDEQRMQIVRALVQRVIVETTDARETKATMYLVIGSDMAATLGTASVNGRHSSGLR